MFENNIPSDASPLSGADKIDWRLVIQRQMQKCINSKGSYDYFAQVDRLVDTMNSVFYGLDLATPINKRISELNAEYKIKERELQRQCPGRSYQKMHNRIRIKNKLDKWYYEELFCFCRDLLAKKRGLMWGKRAIQRGSAMADGED